jgi:glucan phosphoethanolaminetransferase (alkaline phosphatase superfamily)
MGEQPNPWNVLPLQDVMSRHRGAKPSRRCELLGKISLFSFVIVMSLPLLLYVSIKLRLCHQLFFLCGSPLKKTCSSLLVLVLVLVLVLPRQGRLFFPAGEEPEENSSLKKKCVYMKQYICYFDQKQNSIFLGNKIDLQNQSDCLLFAALVTYMS